MGESTGIQWADSTFNPWHGCSKISPGCDNCYAERDSKRFNGNKILWGSDAERLTLSDSYWNQPLKWDKRAFEQGIRPRVFCASMADIFDKNAPEGQRERLWRLIKATPNLDWLILTKRIGNAVSMLPSDWGAGYPNVWLMITVVNQQEAERDIPKLLNTPAVIRGLSMEPLLGYVKLPKLFIHDDRYSDPRIVVSQINWIVVGGESGVNARPMHEQWVRSLHDQCKRQKVDFFFKQWGEWRPLTQGDTNLTEKDAHIFTFEDGLVSVKLGNKKTGRLLDNKLYDEFPHE